MAEGEARSYKPEVIGYRACMRLHAPGMWEATPMESPQRGGLHKTQMRMTPIGMPT